MSKVHMEAGAARWVGGHVEYKFDYSDVTRSGRRSYCGTTSRRYGNLQVLTTTNPGLVTCRRCLDALEGYVDRVVQKVIRDSLDARNRGH